MLAGHENIQPFERPDMPSMTNLPGANPAWQQTMNQNVATHKEEIRKAFLNLSDADLAKSNLVSPRTPPSRARAMIRDNLDMLVDEMHNVTLGGRLPTQETTWYKSMKVFIPPDEILSRHPGFDTAFSKVKATGTVPPALARKVCSDRL